MGEGIRIKCNIVILKIELFRSCLLLHHYLKENHRLHKVKSCIVENVH